MVSQVNLFTAILIIIIILSSCSSSKSQSPNKKGKMKADSQNQMKKCSKVRCSLESSVKCEGCDCGDDQDDCCCLQLKKEKFLEFNQNLRKIDY